MLKKLTSCYNFCTPQTSGRGPLSHLSLQHAFCQCAGQNSGYLTSLYKPPDDGLVLARQDGINTG